MTHEKNRTRRYRELFPKAKEDFWFNEPSVRSAKHPTKYNKRYLKKFKTGEDAVKEAISISDDTPHFHKKKKYSNEHPKYKEENMDELKITIRKYIKMAQDNKKIAMAGIIVLIVIIALIN